MMNYRIPAIYNTFFTLSYGVSAGGLVAMLLIYKPSWWVYIVAAVFEILSVAVIYRLYCSIFKSVSERIAEAEGYDEDEVEENETVVDVDVKPLVWNVTPENIREYYKSDVKPLSKTDEHINAYLYSITAALMLWVNHFHPDNELPLLGAIKNDFGYDNETKEFTEWIQMHGITKLQYLSRMNLPDDMDLDIQIMSLLEELPRYLDSRAIESDTYMHNVVTVISGVYDMLHGVSGSVRTSDNLQ